jgi:alpha-ketoglutarate-dependent taurine dioxygenase
MEETFELSTFGDEALPLVVAPRKTASRAEFFDQLSGHASALRQRLSVHGGLLFRGFPLTGADDFAEVVALLATGPSVNYIGGDSPRNKIKGAVYTSTEAPAAVKIPLHNELSFVRDFPKHIFFYCDVPPAHGGETILGDARRIHAALNAEVRARFAEKQLRYVSNYYGHSWLMRLVNSLQPSHKSWREVFETTDAKQVEALCRSHDFTYAWHDDNWIRISQTRPAEISHPETGERVWFSQAHLYDFNPRLLGSWRWVGAKLLYAPRHMRLHEVFHADGSRIARADLYHIMDVLDAQTVSFPWQRGDVLMLDNVLSMHGRATFTGKRRILAALTS